MPQVSAWRDAASLPIPGARFYADPGPGNVYWGGTTTTTQWSPSGQTIASHYAESTSGPIAVTRRYYTTAPYNNASLESAILTDRAAGRIPWVSIKPQGAFYGLDASGLSARYDDFLEFWQVVKDADCPVIGTTHHEPENDTTETSSIISQWGYEQEQFENARQEIGAVKGSSASVLMSYTFRHDSGGSTAPFSGRDAAAWIAASAPNVLQGIDYYAYITNPTATEKLVSQPLYDVAEWADSRPLVFGEVGQTRQSATYSWEPAMEEFVTWCVNNDVPIMAYFDDGQNSVEAWPFTTAELDWWNNDLRLRSYSLTRDDVV